MNMIERVARAIYDNEHSERTMGECISHAKAAIEAMREPTEEMINNCPGYSDDVRDNYKAMIDAALKE